jgi:hypothetical protein
MVLGGVFSEAPDGSDSLHAFLGTKMFTGSYSTVETARMATDWNGLGARTSRLESVAEGGMANSSTWSLTARRVRFSSTTAASFLSSVAPQCGSSPPLCMPFLVVGWLLRWLKLKLKMKMRLGELLGKLTTTCAYQTIQF